MLSTFTIMLGMLNKYPVHYFLWDYDIQLTIFYFFLSNLHFQFLIIISMLNKFHVHYFFYGLVDILLTLSYFI